MKVIYENTKAYSGDVGDRIDELKKIIGSQQDNLMTGRHMTSSLGNPFAANMMGSDTIDP